MKLPKTSKHWLTKQGMIYTVSHRKMLCHKIVELLYQCKDVSRLLPKQRKDQHFIEQGFPNWGA